MEIGNRVEIIDKEYRHHFREYIGLLGTIVDIWTNNGGSPYGVKLDNISGIHYCPSDILRKI